MFTKFLIPLVLLSMILPAAFSSGPMPASDGWVPLVSVAPVDVPAAVAELDRTGEVTLVVAGHLLRLVLVEHDIFAPGGRAIVHVDENFTQTIVGEVTARAFQGQVKDVEPSAAVVTFDGPKEAIRGTVFLDDRAYFLRTTNIDGLVLLETTWEEDSTPTPAARTPHALVGGVGILGTGNKYTFVRPVASTQYAADPTWTTHVTDVFNQQHAMWDNQVFMHQSVGPFTTVMENVATGSCSTLLASFRSFVAAGIQSGWLQDAYQLFAHNELDCVGLAYSAPTHEDQLTLGSAEMTTVIEAHDHSIWDNYDPDNSYHLGLVSAQELSHNYGEFEHSYSCRAWDFWGSCIDYNVMAAGEDPDDMGFWWTETSHGRIYDDSFHQL